MLIEDENYYFKDGNCVFRVADYLFNIHRSLMAQESPFFERLFSLPQPETHNQKDGFLEARGISADGVPDSNPISCQDSVDSFRALCWGLYAKPIEVRAQDSPESVDLQRLVLLADIAHKYECRSLETWSTDVIQAHWSVDFGTGNATPTPRDMWTLDIIEQLVTLSIKNDTADIWFKKQIETQWLSCGIAKSTNSSGLRRALDFVDNLKIPRLRGLAYYHALKRVGLFSKAGSISDFSEIIGKCSIMDDSLSDLTREQYLALMRGLWCMVSLRCHSLSNMAFTRRRPDCTWHSTCQGAWSNFWTSYNSVFDFGEMLELALQRASGPNPWGSQARCWTLLKPEIEGMVNVFEENLSTYFDLP
ncbi:hypothetical protein P691DRAFT_724788 [Macrolepiota fuliginosa MF-IS2]|uniref:BTB domain-containing protein n=1 Tax=Macrolepiota fuliginosa MF-IS2 TaxID=1400762 RepID=A0A9P6C7A9_9AGAR|nr:hypothetical protein P691DRAFT_724788 [Macrolepiota fuliginosa MF-IS2]